MSNTTKTPTPTAVTNELRRTEFAKLVELLSGAGNEVLQTAGAQVALPVVDSQGEERYAVITLTIPKGSRDGTPYNGYEAAQEYEADQAEKAEKARLRAEKAAKAKAKKEAKAKG